MADPKHLCSFIVNIESRKTTRIFFMSEQATEVKKLLDEQDFGVLSTYSVDVEGFPFGSVTPYSLSDRYQPLIYINNIAQHTKNIDRDSRVALTILEKVSYGHGAKPQSHGRVTIMGKASGVPEAKTELFENYYQRFPEAEGFQQAHGFYLYQIEPVRLRYIGGFGKAFWLEPQDLA